MKWILLFALVTLASCLRDGEFLDVTLIPHSHCDAGWLKTFEQYYETEVVHILTTVTNSLAQHDHLVFNWFVRIGFPHL
jgi:hypothetical protein